jgi:cyclin-dependent kinase
LLDVEHTENKNGKPLLYLVFEYMDSDLKKYIDGYRRSHTKVPPKVIKVISSAIFGSATTAVKDH